MRLKRSLLKLMATTMAVVMFLAVFGNTAADAGLFSKIKDKITDNPVKTALVGVAAVGGTILAAPYIASAVGFAGGSIAGLAGGAATVVASAGTGLAGIGATIWGGVTAAGGFLTGALGAIGGAIGSIFSGIAGFVGGIIGSPLFIPALCLVGAAVAGYYLYKRYKRDHQTIGNSNNIPTVSSSSLVASTGSNQAPTTEIPVSASSNAGTTAANSNSEDVVVSASTSSAVAGSSTELKAAHAEYIKAYNKYINLVTNVGGSESPDEEVRSNLLRTDTQTALSEYREAYNRYVTLLRQSNSK
jgi:hypothetical protein